MSRSVAIESAPVRFEPGLAIAGYDMMLSQAIPGEVLRLEEMSVAGLLGRRLLDLGFTPGVEFRVAGIGPRGNLIAVSLRGTLIALRVSEVRGIGVSRIH